MRKYLVLLVAIILSVPAFAQGKYGKDSADCVKYLSYYREYVKQNNFEEAAPSWRKAISLCPPAASQNMLVDGQKILRKLAFKTKDVARRKELVDSLLMLHDMRAEAFPKSKITSMNNKAIDIINFKWNDDKPDVQFAALGEIIDIAQENNDAVVYVRYMTDAADLYKDGKMSAEEMMNTYTRLSAILNKAQDDNKGDGQLAGAKQDIESIFAESGVASCDNLIALFTPRYEANPNDKATLESIVKLLGNSECFDSDLYLNAVSSLHQLDPNASTAYYLYRLYSVKDQDSKAAQALAEAVSMSGDNAQQASEYSLELGSFYFKKMGRNVDAVNAAKKSIELDEVNAGKAYLLIGTVWGSLKCSGNELERRAPFWVAVDYMTKAKNADASLTDEANNLLAQYRKYFPQQADAFMYDVVDGQSYTVSCGGLRESTVVRTQK